MDFTSPSEAPVPPYRPEPDVVGPVMEGNRMNLQDAGGLLSRDCTAGHAREGSGIELQDVGGLLSRGSVDRKP